MSDGSRWPAGRQPVAGAAPRDLAGPGSSGLTSQALTLAVIVALFLFGAGQGLVGTFFYFSGPVPLAALGFDLLIFATCLLGGWGLRRRFGGMPSAAGWVITVFLLGTTTRSGSVLITSTTAGEVFLFGGAVAAAAGMVIAALVWSRSADRSADGSADGAARAAGSRRAVGG